MSGSMFTNLFDLLSCGSYSAIEEHSHAASSSPASPYESIAFSSTPPSIEEIRRLEENILQALEGSEFLEDGKWVHRIAKMIETGIPEIRFSKQTTGLPFTFRFRKKQNGTKVLLIYGRKVIGKGGFKIVKNALRIDINSTNQCVADKYVIQRIKKEKLHHIELVVKSIELFKQIKKHHKESPTNERLKVGPKMRYDEYRTKKWVSRLEIFQPCVAGSLRQLNRLTPKDKLNVLIDVADGLNQIHFAGFVHRDVKAANIFFCAKEDEKPREGYLGDVDLLFPNGVWEKKRSPTSYYVWDHLAEASIFTSNCDVYGLAFAAVVAFLPRFYASIQNCGKKHKLGKALEQPINTLLLNALAMETPFRPEYSSFIEWAQSGDPKTSEEMDLKLRELFPIEFRLLELFVREFNLSVLFRDKVLPYPNEQDERALYQILKSLALELNLSTPVSLKREFVEILSQVP